MKHGGGKLYIKNKNMLWIHIILIFQKGTNDSKYIIMKAQNIMVLAAQLRGSPS
jgi:hypothetical protein